MIPLRDERRTTRLPWVTWAIIAANVAVFAYTMRLSTSLLGPDGSAVGSFFARFAFVPARFTAAPFSAGAWVTVFAAMFMHGGWLHIGFNMLYLWVFGNDVEDRLGPLRYLLFYLVCGVVATLTQWFAAPSSAVQVIGASGAIAGVLGSYVLLYPRSKITTLIPLFIIFEVAQVPAWIVIGVFFLLQVASAAVSLGNASSGGVAVFAHIGGFLAGMALTIPLVVSDRLTRRLDGGSVR